MYQKKIVFENVQQYFIDKKKGVIVINENNKIITAINPDTFNPIWQTDTYIGIDPFTNGIIVLVDNQYKGIYVNVENGKVNEDIDSKLKGYGFVDFYNSLGYYSLNSSTERKSGVYDFKNDTELWEIKYLEGNKQILSATYFVQWNVKGELGILLTQTAEKIWEFSAKKIGEYYDSEMAQPGRISKVIGLFDKVLVVIISGGGNKLRGSQQLIGLDIQNGELLWLLNDFEYEGTYYNYVPAIDLLKADKNHQYIVSFQGGSFIEIDPKTGKVLRCKNGIVQYGAYILETPMDSFDLQDNYLYFRTVINSISGWPTAVGAFNYQTEQIEWLYVFEEFKKQGRYIPVGVHKVDGNRVYIRDSEGTLYIFEKDN